MAREDGKVQRWEKNRWCNTASRKKSEQEMEDNEERKGKGRKKGK